MPAEYPLFPRKFLAIAFDFDGTLVDTMPMHYEAYRRVFDSMDLELTNADFYSNIGGKASETIPLFLRGREASLTVEEIHRRKKDQIAELFRNAPLEICPAACFLPLLAGRIPLALVSSGSRPGIEQLLERLGWSRFFDVIVTGEDTPRSKPHPMPYQLAAEKLGIAPENIAAFEDTPAGLESAKRAGMSVFDARDNSTFPWS